MAIGDFCTNSSDCGIDEFCDAGGFCQKLNSPPPPPSRSPTTTTETNVNNPITLTVNENIEIKAIFKLKSLPPTCYTIKNNGDVSFSVLYRPPGLPETSSESFAFVAARGTTYVCSTIVPFISRDDLNRTPTLSSDVIITNNNTSCTGDNTCQPAPTVPCKLWSVTVSDGTATNKPQTISLTLNYTDCTTKTSATQTRTLNKITDGTIFASYQGTICSLTSPTVAAGQKFIDGTDRPPGTTSFIEQPTAVKDNPTDTECANPPSTTNYSVTLAVETIVDNVQRVDTRGGTISLAQITNGSVGSYSGNSTQTFTAGTTLSVRAVANDGYRFKNWKETSSTTINPRTFVLNNNTTVTAVFEQVVNDDPPPPQWRNCLTGQLTDGTPPTGWLEKPFSGGGVCYEAPDGTITFLPTLPQALRFIYTRGGTLPSPVRIVANNPSATYGYSVKLTTNSNFTFTPAQFTVPPSGQVTFTAVPTPTLLNQLADGTSELPLTVDITRL